MSKDFLSEEAIYKEHKIQEIEEKVNKYDLLYKSGNKHLIFKSSKQENSLEEKILVVLLLQMMHLKNKLT